MPDDTSSHQITKLLASVGDGDAHAERQLWEAVYSELHDLACAQIAQEPAGRTLQPTALVSEVYLRLFAGGSGSFDNRRHFFAAASQAMHRIRVDDARRRRRLKRGGGEAIAELNEEPAVFDQDPIEVLAVDEAMKGLEKDRPELAEVVRLRYFAGLTVDEVAVVLGITPRTVANRWRIAKATLARAMSAE